MATRKTRKVRAPQDPNSPRSLGVPTPSSGKYGFLDAVHPIYDKWKRRWQLNEARLAGGDDVVDELRRFDWEQSTEPGNKYELRQNQAIYLNFPDIFITGITGHLLRFAPDPSFGKLGTVRRNRDYQNPSQAEMVWYNVDGPGNTGTEWNPWWMDVTRRAAATGHRWLYCEGPDQEPQSFRDEQDGLRPYLVEYSPLDVPMWYFNLQGQLEFAIIRYHDYNPQVDETESFQTKGPEDKNYLLLVRADCTRLGAEFVGGGWWKFTADKRIIDQGTFDDTLGQIPFWPHFYQRHRGTKKLPAISRPGTTELGAAAVSYMNLISAANFNAWTSGQGIEWLAGIDEDGMEIADAMRKRGDRFIALVPNEDTGAAPVVYPSAAGAVPADIYNAREESLWKLAVRIGVLEATGSVQNRGAGNNTGASQQAGFTAAQVPRILHVAQNLANSQNNALYFFELRFGYIDPEAQIAWLNKIDLVELISRVKEFFEVERLAGIRSDTLDAQAMLKVAEENGLVTTDEDRAKFLKEYLDSGALRTQEQINAASEMQDPQNPTTAAKQKARKAGEKATKGGPKQNTGGRPGNRKATIDIKRNKTTGKASRLVIR